MLLASILQWVDYNEDMLTLCEKKDTDIEDLNQRINEFNSRQKTLLGIIRKQKRIISSGVIDYHHDTSNLSVVNKSSELYSKSYLNIPIGDFGSSLNSNESRFSTPDSQQ